jgi:diketogulonate reductase-like aldo/keto reductase
LRGVCVDPATVRGVLTSSAQLRDGRAVEFAKGDLICFHCLLSFRVMPGAATPFEKSMETMFRLQQEGKILHVGVSNVTPDELRVAMGMGTIATVENMYGHGQRTTLTGHHGENRGGEEVLDICEKHSMPLVPYFSIALSAPKKDVQIATLAKQKGVSEAQLHIACCCINHPGYCRSRVPRN